jgi:hypothetical protein
MMDVTRYRRLAQERLAPGASTGTFAHSALGQPPVYRPAGTAQDVRVRLGSTVEDVQLGDEWDVFDFGDDWTHLCTVGPERVDPLETLGIVPDEPLPYFGWGDIPDQYRRRRDSDDGESDQPEDPGLADLPPLRPWWSPRP